MKFLYLIFGLMMIFSPPQSKKGDALRKEVQETYRNFADFSLDFTQTTHWKLAGTTDELTGTILIKKGDLFRMNTPRSVIITDGKSAWRYSSENKQMLINNYEENDDEITPRTFLYDMPDDYRIVFVSEEKLNGADVYKMKLETENFNRIYLTMSIYIDKTCKLIQKIEADDVNGNTTVYTIHNFKSDTRIPGSTFTFKPPDGTEIIDMRTQ